MAVFMDESSIDEEREALNRRRQEITRQLQSLTSEFGDAGTPEKTFTSAGELVLEAVEKVASALAGQISIRNLQQIALPTLSIE